MPTPQAHPQIHRSPDHQPGCLGVGPPGRTGQRQHPDVAGTSNSYLVSTGDGDVVINTGTPYQGTRHRERYEQLLGRRSTSARSSSPRATPTTWAAGRRSTRPASRRSRRASIRTAGSTARSCAVLHAARAADRRRDGAEPRPRATMFAGTVEAEVTTLFAERHEFELGGRALRAVCDARRRDDGLPDRLAAAPARGLHRQPDGALYRALPHLTRRAAIASGAPASACATSSG